MYCPYCGEGVLVPLVYYNHKSQYSKNPVYYFKLKLKCNKCGVSWYPRTTGESATNPINRFGKDPDKKVL